MLAADLPAWFVRVFAFAFGAIWGSFANVVIYRWPRELSVVHPGSHCFACKKPVRPYDNIPIFSWLILRGKCRDCGARFSPRYALVELVFAVVSMAVAERVFFRDGGDLEAGMALAHYAVRFGVAFGLMVVAFIDLDEMLVPWWFKYFAAAPLAASVILPVLPPAVGPTLAIAGAAMGYLGLRALFIDGYKLLTGRRGMGLGDAEVLLVVGALLGPAGVLFSLGAGAVQGVLAAGIAMVFRVRIGPDFADEVEDEMGDEGEEEAARTETETEAVAEAGASEANAAPAVKPKMKVPFVPFLALAALEYLLGADALVQSYLRLIRGE